MKAADISRNQRVKEIFLAASDLSPVSRDGFLREICGSDHSLWSEVRELLSIHERQDLALDETPLSTLGFPNRPFPLRHVARHQPGDLLAERYRVTRFLAAGGMGEVYAVRDETKPRGPELALKFIRAPLSPTDEEQIQARFQREVRLARRIVHPNVCRVYSLERHGEELFCVMDLLAGQTLSARLQSGPPMTPAEALPLIEDICAGLAAAHEAGVLHRDLKPANIFLAEQPGERTRAVIIDFGLASARTPGQTLTADGVLIGTLAYMAPEQLEEGRASIAGDLYSLGAVMFEMLMGKKHLDAPSPIRLALLKAKKSRHAPHFGERKIPAVWREAILKCLKADPTRRFRNAGSLSAFLKSGRPSAGYVLTRTPVLLAWMMLALGVLSVETWRYINADFAPPAEARAIYRQAARAFDEARPLEASKILAQVVAKTPGYVHARTLLAAAYFELDQSNEARDALLEAAAQLEARTFPGRAESLALKAARAAVTGDARSAARDYAQLAALLPPEERATPQFLAAQMWERSGDLAPALAALKEIVQRDPRTALWARIRYAALLDRKRDRQASASQFAAAQAVLDAANNKEGLSALLLTQAALFEADTARQHAGLDRVMTLARETGNDYHRLSAQFRRAALLAAELKFDESLALARSTAVEAERQGRDDLAARALADAGFALHLKHRPADAISLLEQAVQVAEKSKNERTLAANRMRLGEIYAGQRDFAQARLQMQPAMKWLRANREEALLMVALSKWVTVCLNTRGGRGEALAAAGEAVELARRHGAELAEMAARQRLGGIYALSDPRLAAETYESALPIARKYNAARPFVQAASVNDYLGEFQRATGLLNEAAAIAGRLPQGEEREYVKALIDRQRRLQRLYQGHGDSATRTNLDAKLLDQNALTLAMHAPDPPATLTRDLTRLAAERAARQDGLFASASYSAAAYVELRTGRAAEALRLAKLARDLAVDLDSPRYEFDAQMILRAAALQANDRALAAPAEARVRELVSRLGLAGVDFHGRRDLVRLWTMR